jgi:hypothetical protein
MNIKFHTNWCDDNTIREHFNRCTPNNDYKWKDLYISPNNYDFLIILNHALDYPHNPANTICFFSEPISTRNHFKNIGWNPSSPPYFFVYDTNTYHNLDKWYINLNYSQLLGTPEKSQIFSGIISGLRGMEGHEDRINFVYNYLNTIPYYHHYGRGITNLSSYKGQLNNKEDGLLTYKYTFNCENTYEDGYFTEKLLDAIMCETLCFYSGCPNVEKYINPECFIRINLKDPKNSLDIITNAINNKEWEKRLPIIKQEKQKLMNDMNPLNIIWKIIHKQL